MTGKVLDYRTKNRLCSSCSKGCDPSDHDCRLNYVGSAKRMEAVAGADLVNNSKILKGAKLQVRVIIGDDDAQTIDEISRGSTKQIFKLSDSNHLNKNFSKDLYIIKPIYREMKKAGVIAHLKKCFSYCIAKNKGNSKAISTALKNIPNHVFGNHTNCGNWCLKSKKDHTILLKDNNLFQALSQIFKMYAANAHKFSISASSQRNECLNQVITKTYPKDKCYSRSESGDFRVACGVVQFNEGTNGMQIIKNLLHLSPGQHTKALVDSRDRVRKERSEKIKLASTKARRQLVKKKREILKTLTENREGTSYQQNCGITLNAYSDDTPNNLSLETVRSQNNITFVYYDLETSGLYGDADILQIAAKSGEKKFSVYITPTQAIDPRASEETGLTCVGEKLFYRGTLMETIPLHTALYSFYEFLKKIDEKCLLLAYNGQRFDDPRLLRKIKSVGLIDKFANIVHGFCDPELILKKTVN